jgi:hypothetical protein
MEAFIAFIRSIPQLVKLVTIFIDKWQAYEISKIEAHYSDKDKKRSAIINAIKRAETDEERKTLLLMLYSVNNPSTNSH